MFKNFSSKLKVLDKNLYDELTIIWNTDDLKRFKPSPFDEARWGLAIIEDSLWDTVPKVYRKLNSIFVKNIDGPLNHLSNNWTFTDKKNGITEITFDIDFEIKSKFLNSLMVVSFQFGLEKIADAFQKRAEELFGSSMN